MTDETLVNIPLQDLRDLSKQAERWRKLKLEMSKQRPQLTVSNIYADIRSDRLDAVVDALPLPADETSPKP